MSQITAWQQLQFAVSQAAGGEMKEPDCVARLRQFAGEARSIEAQDAEAIIEYIGTLTGELGALRAYASHRELCADCRVPHGPCPIGLRLIEATKSSLHIDKTQAQWLSLVDRED